VKGTRILFVFLSAFLCAGPLFAQYSGGDNDGSSANVGCIQSLNGTTALIPGPISGSTEFCAFATEVYSLSPSGTTSSTNFVWTVPAGATIVSGQGTSTILVSFGNTNGSVAVDVSNECITLNSSMAVSQGICGLYAGGDNDGFSTNIGCIQQLSGGPALIPGPIVGSTEFCPFATEVYTITVAGATPAAVYTWTVPAGATITSGQGTNTILVTFGGTNGNVSVDISNECETVSQTLAVTAASCTFFAGGSNDGFSGNVGCIQTLNGTSSLLPGPIVGSVEFCPFATEAYTITVSGATPSTVYTWTVPPGATVTAGQGTNSILITFGGTNGTISVDVSNECATASQNLPVTTSSCTFFAGGSNDGFASNEGCIQSLSGGSALIAGPVVGPSQFCAFATESYTITVAGATAATTYSWSVPAGATVTAGQGTNTILVTFGNTNGNVSVVAANTCSTTNASLAVALTSCLFYGGGPNDGFSVTTSATNIPLPIELSSFTANARDGKVFLNWTTDSEINNDFFQVQRSQDGAEFESISRIAGAGTTALEKTYQAIDAAPYAGRSYYRLVQTDFDGTKTYSWIVAVELDLPDMLMLYPNPVHPGESPMINYYSEKPEAILVYVVDASGRGLTRHEVAVQAGWNKFPMGYRPTSPGTYVVHIRTLHGERSLRVVVLD
jgi:hypothetical protein